MGDDVLVWYQKLRAVARLYRHIAGTERGDPAIGAPTSITSPGLTDLSSSRTIPLNRFETVRCSPSPTPTPSAPVNSAKVVRSIPMLVSDSTTAKVTKVALISLPRSTRARGVISETRVMRRSNRLDATVAAHSNIAIESTPLTTVRIETRSPPTT